MQKRTLLCTAILLAAVHAVPVLRAEEPAVGGAILKAAATEAAAERRIAARPTPKALSANVKKGLAWLAEKQLPSGAWGQGEESQNMGARGSLSDLPNVADTCMATMALFRAGHTPRAGEYRPNVLRAVDYICTEVEGSDDQSLFITSLRNTRTQSKLGTYIDTFMAAQLLAEIKGLMPDEAGNQRVDAALAKVIKKIEANQKENGQWVNAGWAPTLAQAACAKALNTAAVKGAVVNEQVRERAEAFARADYGASKAGAAGIAGSAPAEGTIALGTVAVADLDASATSGPVASPAVSGSTATFFDSRGGGRPGDAGVKLYSSGAQIAAMQASADANAKLKANYQQVVNSPASNDEQKQEAQRFLTRFSENERDLREAQKDLVKQLGDDRFIAGFGSNGGEEFLSYLNIGESLCAKGGEDWQKWDEKISANLNQVQNADGSWTGHHCITGRTFCTSAALMVLTIDRTPQHSIPEQEIKKPIAELNGAGQTK